MDQDHKQELVEKIRENYLSIALGILVFLVAVTLIFRSGDQAQEDLAEETSQETPVVQEEVTYIVRPGESISIIARDQLGDIDYATDIIEANDIVDPDNIEVGETLILPPVGLLSDESSEDDSMMEEDAMEDDAMEDSDSMKGDTPDDAMMEDTQTDRITGDTYTVQKGDHLWDIAERAYGDGNNYTLIIEANNLQNPDRLEEGTVLNLPRNAK